MKKAYKGKNPKVEKYLLREFSLVSLDNFVN